MGLNPLPTADCRLPTIFKLYRPAACISF